MVSEIFMLKKYLEIIEKYRLARSVFSIFIVFLRKEKFHLAYNYAIEHSPKVPLKIGTYFLKTYCGSCKEKNNIVYKK